MDIDERDLLELAYYEYKHRPERVNHSIFTWWHYDTVVWYLLSYRSVVAGIDTDKKILYIFPYHDYSTTTSRHVYNFFEKQLGFIFPAPARRDCLHKVWKGEISMYNGYTIKSGNQIVVKG